VRRQASWNRSNLEAATRSARTQYWSMRLRHPKEWCCSDWLARKA